MTVVTFKKQRKKEIKGRVFFSDHEINYFFILFSFVDFKRVSLLGLVYLQGMDGGDVHS